MRWPFSARVVAPEDGPGADLLHALLSSEPNRIRSAACTIVHLRDDATLAVLAEWIERIERATAGIALGGVLVGHDVHLQFALRRLRQWRDRAGCVCGLYPQYPFFDPRREIERGHVRFVSVGEAQGSWGDAHSVSCVACGNAWIASDREYHYPWWEWAPAG